MKSQNRKVDVHSHLAVRWFSMVFDDCDAFGHKQKGLLQVVVQSFSHSRSRMMCA